MESGSVVPRTSTGSDERQHDTPSIVLSTAPRLEDPATHRNGDLRSTVAHRFMRMLRLHDRARIELLAAHPPQAK